MLAPSVARLSPTTDIRPALWGGIECTVNRVHDHYHCQQQRSGHSARPGDIDRFAALGIQAIRYPALWEHLAHAEPGSAPWRQLDASLAGLRRHGITPILGLVHHGSGPAHTSLVDEHFAAGLAAHAARVAWRYPWVRDYTPVNEPLTTARISTLYGAWYPHLRCDRAFVRALLNQCRATVLAMQAVRAVNPAARLIQTDDLGRTYGTPAMADVVAFYNERRWLGWDLLCGRVDGAHPMRAYLLQHGAGAAELDAFIAAPCPPDVIGINYYVTGERWLDERTGNFPPAYHGGRDGRRWADIEITRALSQPLPGIGPLLHEAWQRYGLPLAVTEVHIDANREDQLRWLAEAWQAARQAQQRGAVVEAVTVWALLGSYDWNSLVTQQSGYYEPGAYDVRSTPPRPTALAGLMQALAAGDEARHPVLAHGHGWWRRARGRFLCDPPIHTPIPTSPDSALDMAFDMSLTPSLPTPIHAPIDRALAGRGAAIPVGSLRQSRPVAAVARPLLIVGAGGTLGSAFARVCAQRDLHAVALDRRALDATDRRAVAAALAEHRPWAVVNAAGYVRVDEAESHALDCLRMNLSCSAELAQQCRQRDLQLLTFSSDLVFDGQSSRPYLEGDAVQPLNVYGHSKAAAERAVLAAHGRALVVRTSAFFGPWDEHNFLAQSLCAAREGRTVWAAEHSTITPTYVPDLVHACLDLLIDGESGLWHLSNGDAVSWAAWFRDAATRCGLPAAAQAVSRTAPPGLVARRPRYSALGSERGRMLPPLASAMDRFCRAFTDGVHSADLAMVAVR